MQLPYFNHVICQSAYNIGIVYHASVVRGYVSVSASSSLIYHFWSLKHYHSAATHHYHRRCETQLSYPWKRHACKANNYFLYIFFGSMYLVLFSIVLYRTIVTAYIGNIFLYNYLRRWMQPVQLSSYSKHFRWRSQDHFQISFGSDIWFQDDIWEASSLDFQSSCSKTWYLEEVMASIPLSIASWETFRCFVLAVSEYYSAVWCSASDTHLKLLYDRVFSAARFLTGGVF